ncbi:MAG TPA: DUF3365 domain-containing protein [Isosphaeraceae bacterium]|nr:DUF3365 domain-containing protein [Isosphaeraceae bacterium]
MRLLVKLNAILIPVLGAGLALTAWVAYRTIEAEAFEQVKDQARLVMESAQAVRDYTSREVVPLLKDREGAEAFHPQAVPAYAARTTTEMVRRKGVIPEDLKQFIYREPSDNPTLFPQDLATWEKEVINLFRNDPGLTEQSEDDYASSVGRLLYLAHPMRVDGSCLACHGRPEDAPPAMVKRYGDHGFGWTEGDVAAIKIVSVPRSVPIARARRAFLPLLAALGLVAALTLLILNAALYRIVARPVARLSAWADGVSRGDLGRGELPVVGGAEVATLTAACNRLYLSLLQAMDQLKKR